MKLKLHHFSTILKRHFYSILFLVSTFCVYFVYVFSHMLSMQKEGLWAGHVHVWGDWSLHLSMANIFAYKDPSEWFAYHPYYAGGKLTYGFLTNMISGLLVRFGVGYASAFTIPSIIYSILLVFGMYTVYYLLLRSQKAALASVTIFLCSSGLGFLRFLADWLQKPTLQHLLYPTKDYTRIEPIYQWLAGNWINGMLVPQRAYLLGMTITVWVLAGVLWVVQEQKKGKHLSKTHAVVLVCCGLGAGILPITHMHSFIVLTIASSLLGVTKLKLWKHLLWYAVPAGALSIILYWQFVKGGIQNPKFMQILIGWTSEKTVDPISSFYLWLKMWWQIWGVMMPIALAGLVVAWKKLKLTEFAVCSTGFAVFALANIVLFQPIHWDNSKLFMWAYFFFAGLAALVLQSLWRKGMAIRVFAVVLALLLTASGVMELWRLARFDRNSLIMANADDIELGRLIRLHTNSQAIFLTAPTHNHPAMVWGVRPVLLGYTSWAWNFGFLYQEREQDIRTMYKGGESAIELLKKYKVSYVSFGPHEITNFFGNEAFFSKRYPLVMKNESHRFYDVRSVTGGL